MNGKKKERTKKQSIIIFIVLFIACFLLGLAGGHISFSAGGGGLSLGEHIPRLAGMTGIYAKQAGQQSV